MTRGTAWPTSRRRSRGRDTRETRLRRRARLNDLRLETCSAGVVGEHGVRPCHRCEQPVYWHVTAEGEWTLRDADGPHWPKCPPCSQRPKVRPPHERPVRHRKLSHSGSAVQKAQLLAHVVPGDYGATVRPMAAASGKSIRQARRYVRDLRAGG